MGTEPRVLLAAALCMALAFGLISCGGGDGDSGGSTLTGTVTALYNANGVGWNNYVVNDGAGEFTATGAACTSNETGGYSACLHGGELRAVVVTGKSSCTGLTASDSLGAFDWTCDESTSPVRMVSTGLKDGKNLSDLLDFATPGWKGNSVTVYAGGRDYLATNLAAWWSNPVVIDNDGGYLDAAGTIYVVTNDVLGTGYIINAPSVGLVGLPGLIINGPGTNSHVISADGSAGARDFLWVEGAVDVAGDYVGIYLDSVSFSMLRNVTAENAPVGTNRAGVLLSSSSNNTLSDVTASNNYTGIILASSSNNKFSDVTASNNGYGVYLYNSSNNNTLSGVTASNNYVIGVHLYNSSNNNTLSGVTASNNGFGVCLYSSSNNTLSGVTASNNHTSVYLAYSPNNTIARVTASNNGYFGVYLYSSSNNTLSGVTASNNGYNGVYLYDSSNNNTIVGVAASNNRCGVYLYDSSNNTIAGVTASNNYSGIWLTSSSDNNFTGLLKVGTNAFDCYLSGTSINPGLVHKGCTTTGDYLSGGTGGYGIGNSSDATLYNGVTLSGSFVGKVAMDDSANESDTGSAVAYPADPAAFDWSNFENTFRGWGLDGTFGQTDSRGRFWDKCSLPDFLTQTTCKTNGHTWNGAGRIWDWSLFSTDTAIKDSLLFPTGNSTLIHTWSDSSTATFLRNAVEISDDGTGNDNTLCESGETCLYTPNIGSYQGHGSLTSAGTFTDGDPVTGITGVTLMKYEKNGH